MGVGELIKTINKHVDELDYATARLYMERNIDVVEANRRLLNTNARAILKFLIEQKKSGDEPLTRKEILVINAVNDYARQFDLHSIKVLLKNHSSLFLRQDLATYLGKDAQEVLKGMGVIQQAS